jgi:hypothetical protein
MFSSDSVLFRFCCRLLEGIGKSAKKPLEGVCQVLLMSTIFRLVLMKLPWHCRCELLLVCFHGRDIQTYLNIVSFREVGYRSYDVTSLVERMDLRRI